MTTDLTSQTTPDERTEIVHEHIWRRQRNVTSRGYQMPAIEVCSDPECGAAREGADVIARSDERVETVARVLRGEIERLKAGWSEATTAHAEEVAAARAALDRVRALADRYDSTLPPGTVSKHDLRAALHPDTPTEGGGDRG